MALASVNLQTKRTPLGLKDYIAVGTGVSRGEDLAERGAVRPTLPLSFSADRSLLNPHFTLYCAFPRLTSLRSQKSSRTLVALDVGLDSSCWPESTPRDRSQP